MQKATASQRSAYLTALSQEIERKLQKALNSPSQRLELLQQLFADIALEIDDRARDIILSRSEDKVTNADEITESHLCFYDVLANHFVIKPENGKCILDLIVLLWSQSFASHIFSLLFHKWLFEVPVENPEALLRYGSALVQGATNVFWIDIQTNTRRFLSLFRYLLEDVALVPTRLGKISMQARRDLFHLLSKFLFFYNFAHMLESFLKHFPISTNTFLIGGPADVFVIELTDQLQKLKVEPVLLHYLSSLRALQGLELRMTTSTRLKACLYSFTSPGGPMYPTRVVRHAAWVSLDLLFPFHHHLVHVLGDTLIYWKAKKHEVVFKSSTKVDYCVMSTTCVVINWLQGLFAEINYAQTNPTPFHGDNTSANQIVVNPVYQELTKHIEVGQYPRHVISLFFRLLYPWYWPFSCWNFIKACITTILYSLLRIIFSSWERMTKSRND